MPFKTTRNTTGVIQKIQKELGIKIYLYYKSDYNFKFYIVDTQKKDKLYVRKEMCKMLSLATVSRTYFVPDGMEHKFSDIMVEENRV